MIDETQPPTTNLLKPMILLADSQLLFYKEGERPYIRRLCQLFAPNQPLTAAYIGASNGDKSEFYQMFQLAMQSIGITNCSHITQALTPPERHFLLNANIILLAGGNIWQGWQTLSQITPLLAAARQRGSVFIGTSAGAIQLGQLGWHDKPYLSNTDLFATLGYVPAIISVHEEQYQWRFLRQLVSQTAGCLPGFGIQAGAGVIVTPDNNLQAIRKPIIGFTVKGDQLFQQPEWQIQL